MQQPSRFIYNHIQYESSLYKTGTGGLRSCGGSRVCNLAARRGELGPTSEDYSDNGDLTY